jgi:hypothetical protein
MKTELEISEAKKAQAALCKEKSWPDFAPLDGICFRCHRQIYQDYEHANGYKTSGKTGLSHITGCPHCNYSYCD